jgi:LPXTG-motif cell wall-anchored protein
MTEAVAKEAPVKLMRGTVRILAAVGVLLSLVGTTFAQPKAPGNFTLRPGGVATIAFEAYCTEFGKFFPQAIKEPNGVAPDKIRAALGYIQQQGLTSDTDKALEANDAIWQLAGAARAPAGGTTTQDVLKNATTPPANPQGTSILDAAGASQVKLTLASWQPGPKVQILSATDSFYGRGTLTVENVSQQDLTLFMPVGTLFPGSEARLQVMGGYPTDVKTQNPQLPNTGAAEDLPGALIALVALVLMLVGYLLSRRARPS